MHYAVWLCLAPLVSGKQCPWGCHRLLHLDRLLNSCFRVYYMVSVVAASSLVEPQESRCWQWCFRSTWTISMSLSPCSLEPSWQKEPSWLTRHHRAFSYQEITVLNRQENWNQAEMFQAKQAVAWGSAVWSAPPKWPVWVYCSWGWGPPRWASGTSTVFIEWSSYYINFMKVIMPGLCLN